MKKFRTQIIIILIAGLVVGLLLLSEQTGFRLVSPVPARGGVYTEALIGNLQRLNPVLDYYNQPDRDVNRLIFSSLIKYDTQGLPIPDLAESWGVSYDGLSYNFQLRENAVWHDGNPVVAEDVLFTIELMRDPDSVLPEDQKQFWNGLDVIALGEKALQFRLAEPFAPVMDYFNFGILPKHLLGGMTYGQIINSEFNLNPIGSGPYQFDNLIVEAGRIEGLILRANSNYYKTVPFLQEFVFRYYPDHQSAISAYKEGFVQGISEIPNDLLEGALAVQDISLYSVVKSQVAMVLFNLNNSNVEFLQNSDIRHAILMALDRKGLIDRELHGQGVIADVPLIPSSWAYYRTNQRIDQNNQHAATILKEAGYVLEQENSGVRVNSGEQLSFSLVHPDDLEHTRVAEAIRSDLAKVGVQVELIQVPYDSLILDYLQPLTYEAALIDINYSRSPDPDPYPFWDQAQQVNGQNYSQWENRVVSQYLEEARVLVDINDRAKLYRNFQVIFSDELPALPLYYPVYNFGINQSIQGVRVGPMYDLSDRFWNVQEWFLLAQSNVESAE
jgi:peptide/nickel transport system substrate-binding protein